MLTETLLVGTVLAEKVARAVRAVITPFVLLGRWLRRPEALYAYLACVVAVGVGFIVGWWVR